MGECGYGGGISIRVFGAGSDQTSAILRLTLLGLVCGQTTMAHIALFARMHWPALKEPLGFLRSHPPHATTISRTLAGVPYEQLQGALTGGWPAWWRTRR